MTDREKLGKMIMESWCLSAEEIVGHLIFNGVVVREKGEWIPLYPTGAFVGSCSVCKTLGSLDSNFCPNCGADMTKGENDG